MGLVDGIDWLTLKRDVLTYLPTFTFDLSCRVLCCGGEKAEWEWINEIKTKMCWKKKKKKKKRKEVKRGQFWKKKKGNLDKTKKKIKCLT